MLLPQTVKSQNETDHIEHFKGGSILSYFNMNSKQEFNDVYDNFIPFILEFSVSMLL